MKKILQEHDVLIYTCADIHRMLWYSSHLAIGQAYGSTMRDRALLEALANKLGVPGESFILSDESKQITAQQYLMAMLGVIEPLSQMFHDIWGYCARTFMRTSARGLDISWDFTFEDASIKIDFEAFRKYRRMLADVPDKAKFNDMCNAFAGACSTYGRNARYKGPRGGMPVKPTDAANAGVASRIYDLCETLRMRNPLDEGYYGVADAMGSLWAIEGLPLWDEGAFPQIRPLLDACASNVTPEDILSLPFWRYRWHIYELWGLVTTLQLFEQRGFALLQSENGIALLEASKKVLIAEKVSAPTGRIYYQPSYQRHTGQSVQPDVVVVRGSGTQIVPAEVAAIVECKQHKMPDEDSLKKLKQKYFNEVAESYRNAIAADGEMVLLNYDAIDFIPAYTLLDNFRPPNGHALAEPLEKVLRSFALTEVPRQIVLIVDGSTSMLQLGSRLLDAITRLHSELGAVNQIFWLIAGDACCSGIDSVRVQIESLSGGESAELFIKGLRLVQETYQGSIAHIVTDLEPVSPVLIEVRRQCSDMAFSVHCLN